MKIGYTLGSLLSLLLLAACGGEQPAGGKKSATSSTSSVQPKKAASASKPASKPAQKPKKKSTSKRGSKRVRRPRVDFRMVKALYGNDPLSPKPAVPSTPEMVALGKTLYHNEDLSQKGNVSCATCHDLSTYGVDHKVTSSGSAGESGDRNALSTYNSSRYFRQFWDGRSETVEDVTLAHLLSPTANGLADEAAVLAKINANAELVEGFKKAFPADENAVSVANLGNAVGAFARTLTTSSKWDEYLDGNQRALSNEELLGFKTFMDVGCNTCHLTRTLGGNAYQKLGVYVPYKGKDTGRMRVTGNEADKYSFRVPSLLNVEKTAPYYHDGSMATLEDAVADMVKNQITAKVTPEQIASIVLFLKALTGKLPEEFVK